MVIVMICFRTVVIMCVVIIMMVGLAIIMMFPQIALWLPETVNVRG